MPRHPSLFSTISISHRTPRHHATWVSQMATVGNTFETPDGLCRRPTSISAVAYRSRMSDVWTVKTVGGPSMSTVRLRMRLLLFLPASWPDGSSLSVAFKLRVSITAAVDCTRAPTGDVKPCAKHPACVPERHCGVSRHFATSLTPSVPHPRPVCDCQAACGSVAGTASRTSQNASQ